MDKNYIEITVEDTILDFEKQMLAGVNIPSLLPVNIVNQNEKNSICFITTGYRAISQIKITDIETLCNIIKSFVRALIVSEQYLLMGGKHFIDMELIFYDQDTKITKLIFGKNNEENYKYGDINIIVEFLNKLKKCINDKVYIQIIEHIISKIQAKNPHIKRIVVIVEEVERRCYSRDLVSQLSFN